MKQMQCGYIHFKNQHIPALSGSFLYTASIKEIIHLDFSNFY